MLHLIRSNIRNKMLLIIVSAMTVILLSVSWGFYSLNHVIDGYSSTVNNNVRHMLALSEMNLTFKTQVQEWKNTLIRGKDPAQLNKYWSRFQIHGNTIKSQYEGLLREMPKSHPSWASLDEFAGAYPPMLTAYQKGYRAFLDSNKDIDTADKSVQGIDRAPTKLLKEALLQAEKDVAKSRENIGRNAENTQLITILVTVFATVLSIGGFVYFVERRLIRPLNRVTFLSTEIAKGDFTHKVEVDGHDQIGKLTQSFVLIQRDLGGVVSGVLSDLQELTKLIDSLFNAFHKIKESLEQQMEESNALQGNMDKMLTSSEGISDSVNEANDFVNDSVREATKGIEMFGENLRNSQSMFDSANSATEIIEQVKRDSDDIGNVVNVINGIAEQTNLLALNAAIEAARAGENGRGFAVVADEVRSLATKTQESTTQISRTITDLQSATDSAVNAMLDGRDKAQISLDQTREAQAFMESLGQAFENISKLNNDITQSAQQQVQEANDVSYGLHEINKHSDQSQHEATVMEDASRVLSGILHRIQDATSVFKLPQ
ncbi:methyl-accepting chemotaxis protein [Planctobacterium marinum]|uniref:Methyl-accepting chemotaxis protein CtpH n=1 Tax=Planctobacterium marinum TaxID=1631968 RepID=A0AA48HLE9_9ALTE|nr:methyl-accepting chemotaxis protein CtpH [Planctobacterium marinum]